MVLLVRSRDSHLNVGWARTRPGRVRRMKLGEGGFRLFDRLIHQLRGGLDVSYRRQLIWERALHVCARACPLGMECHHPMDEGIKGT